MSRNTPEQDILDAALEVIAEKSISGVRMHLIAEKANMVQSNLHYYYKTKHDLLLALYRDIHKKNHEERKQTLQEESSDLEARLQIFFDQKKDIIKSKPATDFARFDYWSEGRSDADFKEMFFETNEVWHFEIEKAIREYAPGISREHAALTARVMVSMMMGASMQYLNHPGVMDLDEYFTLCKGMVVSQVRLFEMSDAAAKKTG